MGCLPFALAHEEAIGVRRAPPVDAGRRVVAVVKTELPERLARPRAAAAVGAMGDGMRHALRLDEKRGHARRQAMGLGFLGRKRLKLSFPRVGQA